MMYLVIFQQRLSREVGTGRAVFTAIGGNLHFEFYLVDLFVLSVAHFVDNVELLWVWRLG